LIDATKYFNASVDACFLVIEMLGGLSSTDCLVYDSLEVNNSPQTIGYHDNIVLVNTELYMKWHHLRGIDKSHIWRSGIKHDCARIMELEKIGTDYLNGVGEVIALEDNYVYPMLKSSDIGNDNVRYGRKYMLVTQHYIGENTEQIQINASKTWHYLENHERDLSNRASSVYQNHPRFSIFGVGTYSFSQWKVAISGLYKRLSFKVIEPYNKRPVVLDDTSYFISCQSQEEAHFIADLLNSKPSQEFYNSMIFWADKRPITIDILKRLNLHSLSIELNRESDYKRFL
jgi:hypothetical protein